LTHYTSTGNLTEARDALVQTIEEFSKTLPTKEEVDRARAALLKDKELTLSDSGRFGFQLSEWIATGDWRLFFLDRDRLRSVTPEDVIGNTPLLGIHFEHQRRRQVIYAKSEQVNMTGSIKDRMALHILKEAYGTGRIRPGDTIAEATSGNTGISFAAIGRALGHPVKIFMPGWMSRERQDLIRAYGAEIVW